MADNQGRGWHGDSEGHREASKERNEGGFNWLPLLLLPLAFFVGWGANEAMGNNNDQTYQSQPGVGGGPNTPCVTPGTDTGQ
jgi:hypothetical protein